MDEVEFVEFDPTKVYIALVPMADLGKFTMKDFPKNVVAGFPKEMIEFQKLEELVDKLGYKLVEKNDPRYTQ